MELGKEVKRHTIVPMSEPVSPGAEPNQTPAPAMPHEVPAERERVPA